MGYDNFAEFKLETEMAGTPDAVRELLMAVWEPAKARAEADGAKLEEMMHADGVNGRLEPWDWRYHAEKRRKAEHDLDEANFDMGFQTTEFVASAMVDLEFHDGAAPKDVMAKQAQVLADMGLPHAITMRHATPHFAHVFSGDGYSSGYYSYMWSEVMDADAFAAFEEAGGAFDAETARALEKNILSTGGSVDAGELYMRFRGRLPGVEALLKGRGLVEA